ncbi:Peroxisome biosynthesis protein pex1 [Coemansia sp. RSA 986]|nr:Peroxisome biosynthesis protein pex1 [Coemansia sp. RSA 986]
MSQKLEVAFRPLRTCHVNLPPRWVAALSGQPASKGYMVLKLGWGAQSTVYVTWAGGSSRGDTQEKLEMDSVYGKRLGIPAESNIKVTVEYVANVGTCTAASVEPADFDDWEILEANAGAVESKLLRQARVVAPGQPIVFWLDASASVCLTPSQITPDPATMGAHACAVLDNDTEIVVAPKVRAHANAERHLMASESSPTNRRRDRIHCLRMAALAPTDGEAEFGTLYAAAVSAIANDAEKEAGVVRIGRATMNNTKDSEGSSALVPPWMGRLGVSATVQPGVLCATAATLLAAGLVSGQMVRAQIVSSPAQSPSMLTIGGISQDVTPTTVRKALAEILDMQPTVVFNVGSCIPASAAHDAQPMARLVGYTVGTASAERLRETPLRIDSLSLPALQIECEDGAPGTDGVDHVDTRGELAGVDAFLETAWTSVLGALNTAGSGGVLLCGRRGSGKSSIARYLAARASAYRGCLVYCRHVHCATLAMDARADSVRDAVRTIAEDALTHQLALLVLDDLDALVPAETEQGDPRRLRRIIDTLVSAIDPRDGRRVVVLATAAGRPHVHPRLFDAAVVADVLEIPAPGRAERELVLASIARASATPLDSADANLAAISYMTEGYMPADLSALYERAAHEATMRVLSAAPDDPVYSEVSVRHSDMERAIAGFRPRSLRGVQLQASQTRWADIGGLQDTRRLLRETLELPARYAAVFATSPLRLRSGVLLYGYPGCGKTLLASAVARECGLNFIGCKGPELLSKYIGSSEQAVRDLFGRAVAAAPCVLFFDEFESIAPRRGHDNTGVTDRVVNQFLTEMDGAEGLSGVYVLAATSRPDLIDPALLRPGRLDKALLCAMPGKADRADILRRLARRLRVADNVDWDALASATDGFSGADLQALVYNAFLESVHAMPTAVVEAKGDKAHPDFEVLAPSLVQTPVSAGERAQIADRLIRLVNSSACKTDDGSSGSSAPPTQPQPEQPTVSMRFFEDALAYTHPSMAAADRIRLDSIYHNFVDSKKGGARSQAPIEQRATMA